MGDATKPRTFFSRVRKRFVHNCIKVEE